MNENGACVCNFLDCQCQEIASYRVWFPKSFPDPCVLTTLPDYDHGLTNWKTFSKLQWSDVIVPVAQTNDDCWCIYLDCTCKGIPFSSVNFNIFYNPLPIPSPLSKFRQGALDAQRLEFCPHEVKVPLPPLWKILDSSLLGNEKVRSSWLKSVEVSYWTLSKLF